MNMHANIFDQTLVAKSINAPKWYQEFGFLSVMQDWTYNRKLVNITHPLKKRDKKTSYIIN